MLLRSCQKFVLMVLPEGFPRYHFLGRSWVVPGCARLCQVVPGCARLCQVVPGCARLCQVVPGCTRLCQVAPGCARLRRALGGAMSKNGICVAVLNQLMAVVVAGWFACLNPVRSHRGLGCPHVLRHSRLSLVGCVAVPVQCPLVRPRVGATKKEDPKINVYIVV